LVSGPVVTQPERMARATASISASVMSGRAKGRNGEVFMIKSGFSAFPFGASSYH